jgi:thiosulfate/3-mercaptopyruvate sulfurtransferase
MSDYAHPEILVDTAWVAQHLSDPDIRLVELHFNSEEYDKGHIPGAVFWNVLSDIAQANDHYRINYDKSVFEQLMARSGITTDMTIIFYGLNLAYGAWATWFINVFGHTHARVMNGGRKKWIAEGRPLTTEKPAVTPTRYVAREPDQTLFATREQVEDAIGSPNTIILDTRAPREYNGELFWLNPPQDGERAGHIPGAVNVNYEATIQEDGMFKPADQLRALYADISSEKEVIPYCTFGARTAHTWFVLKYLLGYENVRGYYAGWYEWGRFPDTPVEK